MKTICPTATTGTWKDSTNNRWGVSRVATRVRTWLLAPVAQTVVVLSLEGDSYRETGVFAKQAAITSVEFPGLELTAEQIFATVDRT
ncbi:MAG TPA: hypothetical protein V6C65_37635 [Allocoleopsis sp.]